MNLNLQQGSVFCVRFTFYKHFESDFTIQNTKLKGRSSVYNGEDEEDSLCIIKFRDEYTLL
jgi:hypothetical protein